MTELDDFQRDFSLTPRSAAQLFGVSTRTWRRWRRRGSTPAHARHMIEVCQEQRAPVNKSLHRGPYVGVEIFSFRERLFGPRWKDWRAPIPNFPPLRRRR